MDNSVKQSDIINEPMDTLIKNLLKNMSLEEKIGQLSLVNSNYGKISTDLKDDIRAGRVGGIINEVDFETVNELQKLSIDESKNQIPLLIGRDVIHGFNTIFPIPLGLAATWNPELAKQCGNLSAFEASKAGTNWTFAPMVDISRDPRWGRVAESFGEDVYLSCQFAKAMVEGLQGEQLNHPNSIAACVKHFAGYGASESGKDYNTTNIPENELRNVHLPPFKAAIDAGAVSLMTSFSDIDGIPASANQFLLEKILRDEWNFDGFVVSDWESISQLAAHGLTNGDKESALEAITAGVDMEMASTTYINHIAELVDEGKISIERIDYMVSNILKVKHRLGLFDNPYTMPENFNNDLIELKNSVKESALQSCVLLKNINNCLPLDKNKFKSIAVIGSMADEPHEQLGTWVFDGDASLSQTPLKALTDSLPNSVKINYVRTLDTTRSKNVDQFEKAVKASQESDIVLMFIGEDAILSGEAHCRADIKLPGVQEELIEAISLTDQKIILVLMTGRPLVLENIIDKVDAILCAWHPGSMGGPAIVDLLLGVESPSGKLPVTFPRKVGQIPIYYSHKNTGRPGIPESIISIDDIEVGALQHSVGNTSFHLDSPNCPLFPFGFGLSYTEFEYRNLKLSDTKIKLGDHFTVTVELKNTGTYEAYETIQLYTRDLVGSVTRPVKELKKFTKIKLKPSETQIVSFTLSTEDLAFFGRNNKLACELGEFHLWVGGSSDAVLKAEFEII